MGHNRRDFIKRTGLVAAGSFLAPSFINSLSERSIDFTGKRLVVIQLSGGNDGLNTIVPYNNDIYYKSRPQISIAKNEVIRLNDELGMNPALTALKSLFDDGLVSLINSVGYPNPDRSHFRSMDIWHTASNADEYWKTGWLGRYLDAECVNCESLHKAIEVNPTLDLAMKGERLKGLAMEDPRKLLRDINGGHNRSIAKLNSGHEHEENSVEYLYKTLVESVNSADYIGEKVKLYKSKVTYPQGRFANNLKTIAEMINSGLETSVYYSQLGGFDTHAQQKQKQSRLLKGYADGVAAFVKDLKANGTLKDTLILTFSEFGRRVGQNASAGTDHGTANNLFVIGEQVQSGIYNAAPDLTDLDNGDLKYQIDFRNVYATVLDKWLGADSQQILRQEFSTLPFLKV